MSEYDWFYDPGSGTLYFPDGTEATDLGDPDNVEKAAQVWTIGVVSDVGMENLTDEQLEWLLSMAMGHVTTGPPV